MLFTDIQQSGLEFEVPVSIAVAKRKWLYPERGLKAWGTFK